MHGDDENPDSVSALRPFAVTVGFLLHPSLRAIVTDNEVAVSKDGAVLLSLRHQGPLAAAVCHPGTDLGGWYSPTFGVKLATTRLIFAGTLAPDQAATVSSTYA